MVKIIILNGLGDDGEKMGLYADDKLIKEATINGAADCPETILDYLQEFGLKPSQVGITNLAEAEGSPAYVTEGRPYDYDENDEAEDFKPFPKDITGDLYEEYLKE